MALPKSAQDQLDRAEAILAAANAPAPQPVPQPPAAQEPPPAPAAVAPAPVVQPVATAPAAPAPAANDAGIWEQRYRSLQGVHRTLQQNHTALQGEVQALHQRLASLESRHPAAPAAPAEPARPTEDPQDIRVFGEDMVKMVHRVAEQYIAGARQVVATEVQALRRDIDALKGAAQTAVTTAAKTAEDVFFDNLTKLVPNWGAINSTLEWEEWLAQPDPVFGRPRQEALDSAHAAGDAQRAAMLFAQFTNSLPPAPAVAPPASPAPRSITPQPPQPPAGPTQVFLTSREVNTFYDDVRRGKYRANPDMQRQREAEINLAMAEGRILP